MVRAIIATCTLNSGSCTAKNKKKPAYVSCLAISTSSVSLVLFQLLSHLYFV